jgi:hypothetical protein
MNDETHRRFVSQLHRALHVQPCYTTVIREFDNARVLRTGVMFAPI